MHLYLRLLREKTAENYSTAEMQELRQCLSEAPGVERVKEVTRHPRGGYSITLEGSKESSEALVAYLTSHGWLPVI